MGYLPRVGFEKPPTAGPRPAFGTCQIRGQCEVNATARTAGSTAPPNARQVLAECKRSHRQLEAQAGERKVLNDRHCRGAAGKEQK